jgi:hypothetical protein
MRLSSGFGWISHICLPAKSAGHDCKRQRSLGDYRRHSLFLLRPYNARSLHECLNNTVGRQNQANFSGLAQIDLHLYSRTRARAHTHTHTRSLSRTRSFSLTYTYFSSLPLSLPLSLLRARSLSTRVRVQVLDSDDNGSVSFSEMRLGFQKIMRKDKAPLTHQEFETLTTGSKGACPHSMPFCIVLYDFPPLFLVWDFF